MDHQAGQKEIGVGIGHALFPVLHGNMADPGVDQVVGKCLSEGPVGQASL